MRDIFETLYDMFLRFCPIRFPSFTRRVFKISACSKLEKDSCEYPTFSTSPAACGTLLCWFVHVLNSDKTQHTWITFRCFGNLLHHSSRSNLINSGWPELPLSSRTTSSIPFDDRLRCLPIIFFRGVELKTERKFSFWKARKPSRFSQWRQTRAKVQDWSWGRFLSLSRAVCQAKNEQHYEQLLLGGSAFVCGCSY